MKFTWLMIGAFTLAILFAGCQPFNTSQSGKKTIVVTYSVLGSLVKELVGNQAEVIVSIPNGQDPHDWFPSAKDIRNINNASLVVCNGLGLESGLTDVLNAAKKNRTAFFTAAEHITIRYVSQGEGIPSGDPDQAIGAPDPHIWTDPLTMKDVVDSLSDTLQNNFNLDVSSVAQDLTSRLEDLNRQISTAVLLVPQDNRKLVTGHESMGYFAQRYGFKLIGVIVPSLSSQAEASAADLAYIKTVILQNQVKAIFTELGTSPAVAKAIGDETGVRVIQLTTHALPPDGSYFTFMYNLSNIICNGLR